MTETIPFEIPQIGVTEHPAVRAWCQLRPARVEPDGIENLKFIGKSAIYRLAGVGSGGAAVIAKRCLVSASQTERVIYGEILPRIPVPTLRFFGFVGDEDARYGWLFIEDAGRDLYLPALAEHRAAAARWLALVHTSAAKIKAAAQLPERGADYYRNQLRQSRDNLTASLDNPALKAGDRVALKEILATHELLESRWSQLEEICGLIPPTFVHGDLKGKNIRVRRTRDGLVLLPFDWEIAGWGTPATDLLRCPDLGLYLAETRAHWPDLKLEDLEQLAWVGALLREVIAIYWKSLALHGDWVEWPVKKIRMCAGHLADVMRLLDIG